MHDGPPYTSGRRDRHLGAIDLELLMVFRTIVDCGGFSAAQAALGMAQSTISQRMQVLESQLRLRLCERGRSGFRLTPAGRTTYAACLRLFAAVEAFHDDTVRIGTSLTGRLRIGVLDNTVTDPTAPLCEAIRRFSARQHSVVFDFTIGAPSELERRLLDGRMHAAIGVFPVRVPGLRYTPLYREEKVLCCGRDHPLAAEVAPAAIRRQLHTERVAVLGYMSQVELASIGAERAAAMADNVEALALLLLSGAYVGFLPRHYASRWLERNDLHELETGRTDHNQFALALHGRPPTTPALTAFLADLSASLPRETGAKRGLDSYGRARSSGSPHTSTKAAAPSFSRRSR